jgi:hypothetical protein
LKKIYKEAFEVLNLHKKCKKGIYLLWKIPPFEIFSQKIFAEGAKPLLSLPW